MYFRFENLAGRVLGIVRSDDEAVARSLFHAEYTARHNINPRDPEHALALKGLINSDFDRITVTSVEA